ncbi:MAG TPA: NAD(+) synthase [Anaeromyxobacteraceae bacterium]|nr:NAD(+) synthase [Anaeromyxobacteraceae bacterium]
MPTFSKQVLELDLEAKAEELSEALREAVLHRLRRRGLVVAVSGGIDSACVAALAARALGPSRVFALLLPERDSSAESAEYATRLCRKLGIEFAVHEISPILEAAGCYRLRDEALRSVFPEFTRAMPWKIAMHGDRLHSDALNLPHAVIASPEGERRVRLTPRAYLQIVAATNFKQRTRKMLEYFHADLRVYAVGGTANRLEHDQGFFVKLGDGAADVKPIAGLYKTQTYALAGHLGVIPEILNRAPTTDTFSLAQSQEEFFFSLDHRELDLILWAKNHGVAPEEVAPVMGHGVEQIVRVYEDIDQKRRTTAYLHAAPILLEPLPELEPFQKPPREPGRLVG